MTQQSIANTTSVTLSGNYLSKFDTHKSRHKHYVNLFYSILLPKANEVLPEQHFCLMMNVSNCDATEKNPRFIATAYNPRSQEETIYVRLPVTDGVYTVIDPAGLLICNND